MKHKTLLKYVFFIAIAYLGLHYAVLNDSPSTNASGASNSTQEKFTVHELDKKFLANIETLSEQLHVALAIAHDSGDPIRIKKFSVLEKELKDIEKKYRKNSPATAILGPFGTAAIVLKEKKLANQLLKLTNNVGTLIHHYAMTEKPTFTPANSLELALEQNRHVLEVLIS
ncbi:hypothetical protein KC460_00785 [Candidatus Dependentiae bacterium]|nr:hypothetical protein [Candidatus Dependentiae bacterium]